MSNKTYGLDQYKTDAQKQLEEKKRNAQQAADINHQKLLKYIPQNTKGFSQGMTESARISASNAYQRQMAEAESDYAADMTDLNNYVRQEQERLDDKAKAEGKELYADAMSMIESGNYNTVEDLEKYLFGDSVAKAAEGTSPVLSSEFDSLSDMQKKNLLQRYQTIKDDPTSAESDLEYRQKKNKIETGAAVWLDDEAGFLGLYDADKEGDDIEVQIPGAENEDLNVRYKKSITDRAKYIVEQAFKNANGREIKEGEVFAYDGEIYIKNHNKLWTLEARGGGVDGDFAELYKHYYPDS